MIDLDLPQDGEGNPVLDLSSLNDDDLFALMDLAQKEWNRRVNKALNGMYL